MKKIFVLLLCAMVLFTACQPALPMEGSKEEAVNSSSAPSEEASSEEPAEPSEEPGETSEEPKEPEPEEPQEPEPEEPKEPEESELWADVPTQAAQVDYRSDDRTYTAVLETVEEKEAFFGEYASSALYGGPVKMEDHYDEAYFEKHRLLVAYTYAGSGSYRLGTESIRWKNGTLEWSYNVYSTGFGTCDMAGWVLLAELPRELPVTAETAVELKGYDVTYDSQASGHFEGSEAMLLNSRERVNLFMGIYCPQGFMPDSGWNPLEDADFEKTCFIAVFVYLWDASAKVTLQGLTCNEKEVEVHFSCPDPNPDNPTAGGRVFLLKISADHPAASYSRFYAKVDCPPPPSIPPEEKPLHVPFDHGYGTGDLPLYEGELPHASVVTSREELLTVLEEFSADINEFWDMFDEDFFAEKALLWGYAEAASVWQSVEIGVGGFDIDPDGTAHLSIKHRVSYQYDGPVVGKLEFKAIERKYGEMIKRVEIDYGVIKEGTQGGYIPYLPTEQVVLNPEYQTAKVVLDFDNPPADVTVLATLREKQSYFSKYAKSGCYGVYGNELPIEIEDVYDEEFFEKNALIAVYRMETSGSNSLKLKEVVIHTDGTVEVVLDRHIPGPGEAGTCDIRQWMFFIPVPVEHPITSANSVKLTVKEMEESSSPELVFPEIDVELPSTLQWTVLHPACQFASVHLEDPPGEAAVLTTFGEKEAFFAKYAQPDEDRYSEAFFESHVLLVVYQREPSMPINTVFDRMVLAPSGKLEVYFTRREPGPYDAVAQRLYFFEIPAEYAINGETPLQVLFQAPPTDN